MGIITEWFVENAFYYDDFEVRLALCYMAAQ